MHKSVIMLSTQSPRHCNALIHRPSVCITTQNWKISNEVFSSYNLDTKLKIAIHWNWKQFVVILEAARTVPLNYIFADQISKQIIIAVVINYQSFNYEINTQFWAFKRHEYGVGASIHQFGCQRRPRRRR